LQKDQADHFKELLEEMTYQKDRYKRDCGELQAELAKQKKSF